MNQLPSAQTVLGDFDNAVLELPTGEVHFTTSESGQYLATIIKRGQTLRRYQVTRTVGSRYLQNYIVKQIKGPEPEGHAIYGEHPLPFAYRFKTRRWLPRKYFNIYGAEELKDGIPQCEAIDYSPDVQPYNSFCMNCHNTYPYAYRMLHRVYGGFRDAKITASLSPLSESLAPAVNVEPTLSSFVAIRNQLDPDVDLVTQGISCESCHFGGREHVEEKKEMRFLPTSEHVRLIPNDPQRPLTSSRENAATINGICIQCHSGDGELFPNGAGKSNSREGLDMRAGFCVSQIRCVDCHEPHTASSYPSGHTDRPEHIALCIKCHTQFNDPSRQLAHSGHPADVAISCLDCHMPRHTRGADELVRTHRIGMPVEEAMVRRGAANACNTCHLDKSIRWTLLEIEKSWGKSIRPATHWRSFDQLDQPAGELWLHSDDSHMRLIATQSYARSRFGDEKLLDLIRSLNDPERVNRAFAGFAVSRILGWPLEKRIPVDITAAPAVRERQISEWLEQLNHDLMMERQETPAEAVNSPTLVR